MNISIFTTCAYLFVLFIVVFYLSQNEKIKEKLSNSHVVYALSLGVYCTAWTFYGSIGRAAETGIGYMAVYLGPTLLAPLWFLIIGKILKISKYTRITSIADFLSSRYGKSTTIGVLVSMLCLIIVIPYIAIQLKALKFSYHLLKTGIIVPDNTQIAFYKDPVLIFGLACVFFAIFFGTVKVDPNEKHPGLVSVVAVESIIKLICFLLGGLIIVYFLFDGVSDIIDKHEPVTQGKYILSLSPMSTDRLTWLCILFMSAFAFLFLPRQFHMAVVENVDSSAVKTASWLTPAYLLLISILVIPIALAGQILMPAYIEPDTYLMSIPISKNLIMTTVIVFIGGLAASSGMIITSLLAMSIMISNNIFLPLVLRSNQYINAVENRLLQLRRLLIISIFILAYGFMQSYASAYSIVSIGLICFAGISQLVPSIILGLYWKFANANGALAGLLVGILTWLFTLPFANLAELNIIDSTILTEGVFGLGIFRPTSLFGLDGFSPIAHSCIWSIGLNAVVTVTVSLYSSPSALEIAQTDIFLNPDKYLSKSSPEMFKRKAHFNELKSMLSRVLGDAKIDELLLQYQSQTGQKEFGKFADAQLINFLENQVTGTIGTASSRLLFSNIVQNIPVDKNQIFNIVNQSQELYNSLQNLERKSNELELKTAELKKANEKLLELDQYKSEFISNVTHELRTPLTSIQSLSHTLSTYALDDAERQDILNIIKSEARRLSELVNQVLDLRKVEVDHRINIDEIDLKAFCADIVFGFKEEIKDRSIALDIADIRLETDISKLRQILLNLLSNAIKYTKDNGSIKVSGKVKNDKLHLDIRDNGRGIKSEDIPFLFDRFFQARYEKETKAKGSGLGLSITKSLVELLQGQILITSTYGVATTVHLTFPIKQRKTIEKKSQND